MKTRIIGEYWQDVLDSLSGFIEREMKKHMIDNPRIKREAKTVDVMIHIYCHGQHGTKKSLCSECQELLEYAMIHLDKCPFQEGKTTCANCPVHCYKKDMRDRIRAVMRYAGPRMPRRHPILSVYHFLDGRRKEPIRAQKE